MRAGFISLIIILIAIAILIFLYMSTNPFSPQVNEEIEDNEDFVIKDVTTPQRIEQTQDVVNEFQQKSIERQSIEIE